MEIKDSTSTERSCYVIFFFSEKKKNNMVTDAELACDQAHYYLVIKARTRWHDLARVRRMFSLNK